MSKLFHAARWFASRTSNPRERTRRSRRLAFESLETRRLLTGGVDAAVDSETGDEATVDAEHSLDLPVMAACSSEEDLSQSLLNELLGIADPPDPAPSDDSHPIVDLILGHGTVTNNSDEDVYIVFTDDLTDMTVIMTLEPGESTSPDADWADAVLAGGEWYDVDYEDLVVTNDGVISGTVEFVNPLTGQPVEVDLEEESLDADDQANPENWGVGFASYEEWVEAWEAAYESEQAANAGF